MSVYQTDHFYGFFSAINSEAIKDIQIYKGGIPVKYGGRSSSVIELTGKQGNTKKRKISIYSNLITAGLTYEEPLFEQGDQPNDFDATGGGAGAAADEHQQ